MNKKSDKDKWFVACVPMQFRKLKGMVETPNRRKYVHTGCLFKCLIEDTNKLNFIWMSIGHPEQLFRPATKKEIQIYS
jgi:hypothetical protein